MGIDIDDAIVYRAFKRRFDKINNQEEEELLKKSLLEFNGFNERRK